MRRVLRGLLALAVLLAGVVGVPAALVVLGGNPLPDPFTWAAAWRALIRPDDGTVLVGIVTVVGWLAWATFALSVLAELVQHASGSRIRIRLPGLRAPQRLAASLVIAVFALSLTPQVSRADPSTGPALTSVPPSPGRPDAVAPAPTPTAPHATRHVDPDAVVHEVVPGDDLWSLAERYYGAGPQWRKIAAANRHVLSGGPDRLQPGWRLTIPEASRADHRAGVATVTVHAGDTLTSIAEQVLGDGSRWPELFHANRTVLSDPDELAVGMLLVVPGHASDQDQRAPEKGAQEKGAPEKGAQENPASHEPAVPKPAREKSEPHGQRDPASTGEHAPPAGQEPQTNQPTPAVEPPAPPEQSVTRAEPRGAQLSTLPGVVGLASVGGLLAAGVIAGLAARRRVQLQARPLGRRILHPQAADQRVETDLGARQRPMSLRTLDLALRAVSAFCLQSGTAVPRLALAKVGEDQLELTMTDHVAGSPVGFRVQGRSWLVDSSGARYLKTVPGVAEAVRPYPALVTLGTDEDGRQVLADLEGVGLLALDAPSERAEATLAAMAVELSFSPWADEMILTLVGVCPGLSAALGKHNVAQTEDFDAVLARLEARAAMQRENRPDGPAGHSRIDPDLADPWAPEIVLVNQPMSPQQEARLVDLLTAEPRPTMAAVVAGSMAGACWSLTFGREPDDLLARLEPAGVRLTPQRVDAPAQEALVSLIATTGSEVTTGAPWWEPPDPPPDNVTFLGKRFGGWGTHNNDKGDVESDGAMSEQRVGGGRRHHHPVLQLLGPIELLGATGELPPRASKQCLEYCGWLLEHPGTTAQAMASALVVAEGTRRSNMSRLRTWLGASPQGEPYLPDAYSGHIMLHPAVSSDWQRLQILTARGVSRTSDDGLHAALELVRGAPLADAAPGQWHWAEELRTDMISAVRDIGVELANRALDARNLDLARWAAARALVAAPGDELLMTVRIRTEHQAGNDADTERLTLQLASHARALGVDLDSDTVELLQRVMEGRVRARMA